MMHKLIGVLLGMLFTQLLIAQAVSLKVGTAVSRNLTRGQTHHYTIDTRTVRIDHQESRTRGNRSCGPHTTIIGLLGTR